MSATDDNGGTLEPGDVITYTIAVHKLAQDDGTNTTIQSSLPANTTYVPGSTTLNGVSVPDVSGASAVGDGLTLQTPGAPAGELIVGDVATVTFQVVVNDDVVVGTVISGQSFVDTDGRSGGDVPTQPSDSLNTPGDGEPVLLVVGDAALLVATKTVTDENGGDAIAGDTVLWEIIVRNDGARSASDVVVSDVVPADTIFIAGSITLDAAALTDALDTDEADFNLTAADTVTVSLGSLAAGTSATVTFRCTLDGSVTPGDTISNQASIDASDATSTLSDTDGNVANGEQPTMLVVGHAPALQVSMVAADVNGGDFAPGDVIEYVIEVVNGGTSDATNVVLTKALPTSTTYVAGSTDIDGAAQADVGPDSPLVSGLNIGTVPASGNTRVRVRIAIDGAATAGTTVQSQVSYTLDGGLTGVSDSELDDGVETGNSASDPNDDDPTWFQVGGTAGSGVVGGTVFLDEDHDRSIDVAEPELQNWTVELVTSSGNIVATDVSDANGLYNFTGVPPASGYQVHFRHPSTGTVLGGIPSLDVAAGSMMESDLPLDPSGVAYNSITRAPIAGVVATLSGPAGFDPVAHLFPGQQGQTTAADGFYRFDLLPGFPAGVYTLSMSAPSGFTPLFPSAIIPPTAGPFDPTGLPDPHAIAASGSAPVDTDPTIYYVQFALAPGDPNVVNNHVAIDPILDSALVVLKTSPVTKTRRGDLVPYTVQVTNTLSGLIPDVDLIDFVPPGFKYVSDSAFIDGVQVEPQQNGRELRWAGLSFNGNQVREMKLILVAGAGVKEGLYTNLAWVVDGIVAPAVQGAEASAAVAEAVDSAGLRVSNVSQVSLDLVPDTVFDYAEILGKVFDDQNANGYQDDGEPGIAGARIATATGLVIKTDEYGRYHLTAAQIPDELRGSNFILKLDPRSLPSGYRLTTENPRVVRLTRGKITKANFGVNIGQVARVELASGAFESRSASLRSEFRDQIVPVLKRLDKPRPVVRIAYRARAGEYKSLVRARVADVRGVVEEQWKKLRRSSSLRIEETMVWVDRASRVVADSRTSGHPIDDGVETSGVPASDTNAGLGTDRDAHPMVAGDDPEARATSSTPPRQGKARDLGFAFGGTAPPNAENEIGFAAPSEDAPVFLIGIDGESPAVGDISVDKQRRTDVALSEQSIRMSFDGHRKVKVLNVTPWPDAAVAGEPVTFRAYTNYLRWIERGEVRVFDVERSTMSEPLAVLPLDDKLEATWTPPSLPPSEKRLEVHVVLRVYDADGTFDETAPKVLPISVEKHPQLDGLERQLEEELLVGYGRNHLLIDNIAVEGGTVLVHGKEIPDGHVVVVEGQPVPLDATGAFAAEQIVPGGTHNIEVEIRTPDGGDAFVVSRDIYLRDDDWFLVALADLTVGANFNDGEIAKVTGEHRYERDVLVDGRLAFYLKGKILGKYILTASLDTTEEDIGDIFSNLSDRDPRQLLRRLDPDQFYPVYGDDSTVQEDAPTQGRFYVKIEAGNSYVMWGNYKTEILGTELMQVDRGLYGARLHYESQEATKFGEKRTKIDGFGALPDTIQMREDHRGTGGSLYYLRHQDITIGSERVRMEVRDKDSQLVLAAKNLVPNQDYDIDPLQGRILLTRPLPSVASDGMIVDTSGLSGNPVYLVVRYEYQAAHAADVDELAIGGRASRTGSAIMWKSA